MPWTQKQMLRDANGDLIPQYWDVVEQEFKPLTGSDGANDVRLTGNYVKEIVIVKGLEVSAGSIANIGAQNLEDAEYLSLAIRSGKAHDFVATAQRQTSDGLFLDQSPSDRLQLLNVSNKFVALSERFSVTTPRMMFFVQNNSTETQTYDVYLYKIGSKVM